MGVITVNNFVGMAGRMRLPMYHCSAQGIIMTLDLHIKIYLDSYYILSKHIFPSLMLVWITCMQAIH